MSENLSLLANQILETLALWNHQIELIHETEVETGELEDIQPFNNLQKSFVEKIERIRRSKNWTLDDQTWYELFAELWSKSMQLKDEYHVLFVKPNALVLKARQKSFALVNLSITPFIKSVRRELSEINQDDFKNFILEGVQKQVTTEKERIRQTAFRNLLTKRKFIPRLSKKAIDIKEKLEGWKDKIELQERKEDRSKTLQELKSLIALQQEFVRDIQEIRNSADWTPEDETWYEVYSEIWSKNIQLTDESHVKHLQPNAIAQQKQRQKAFSLPNPSTYAIVRVRNKVSRLDIDNFNAYILQQSQKEPTTAKERIRQLAFQELANEIENEQKDVEVEEEEEEEELHQMPCPDKSQEWADGLTAFQYLDTLTSVPEETLNLALGSVLLFQKDEPYFGIWSETNEGYENDVSNEEEAKIVIDTPEFKKYREQYETHVGKRYFDFTDPELVKDKKESEEEWQARLLKHTEAELAMAKERNSIWKDLIDLANLPVPPLGETKTLFQLDELDSLNLLAARFLELRLNSTTRIEVRYVKALYHCGQRKEVIDKFFTILETLMAKFSEFFFDDDDWSTIRPTKTKNERDLELKKLEEKQQSSIIDAENSSHHIIDALQERQRHDHYHLHLDLKDAVERIMKPQTKPNSEKAIHKEIQALVSKIKGDANVLSKETIFSAAELEMISKIPLFEVQELVKDDKKAYDIWKSIVKEIYLPDWLLNSLAQFKKISKNLQSIKVLEAELKKSKTKIANIPEQLEKWYVLVEALRDHTDVELEQLKIVRQILDVGADFDLASLKEAMNYAKKINQNTKLFKTLWPKEYARLKEQEQKELTRVKKEKEKEAVLELNFRERARNDNFVENPIELRRRKNVERSEHVDEEAEENDDESDDESDEEEFEDAKNYKEELQKLYNQKDAPTILDRENFLMADQYQDDESKSDEKDKKVKEIKKIPEPKKVQRKKAAPIKKPAREVLIDLDA